MSTNTSQNLGLHLWEPTDQVLRTEFNQNWQKIDTAVDTAQQTADTAESKADTAQATATAAQTAASAAYCPSNKPYAMGSYTGNGGTQSILLGFQPSFLIITAQPANSSDTAFIAISGGSEAASTLSFTETGFTVMVAPTPYETYPLTNQNGRLYHYLAIR